MAVLFPSGITGMRALTFAAAIGAFIMHWYLLGAILMLVVVFSVRRTPRWMVTDRPIFWIIFGMWFALAYLWKPSLSMAAGACFGLFAAVYRYFQGKPNDKTTVS